MKFRLVEDYEYTFPVDLIYDEIYKNFSTYNIKHLLNINTIDYIDNNSPMFILPSGDILSVKKTLNDNNVDKPPMHISLVEAYLQKLLENFAKENPKYSDHIIEYTDDYIDRTSMDLGDALSVDLNWVKINCGDTGEERRFYCVLPSKITPAQLDIIEEWLEWGVKNNKKNVQIMDSYGEEYNIYSLSSLFPEDVIKKIKRFYSSGILYEDNRGANV